MALALILIAAALMLGLALVALRRSVAAGERRVRELENRAEELESINADLSRANQELESFANVASHDLREPLLVIEGFSGLLQRRAADELDAEGLRFVENIRLGVERMQLMIDGLLDYSRAGARAEEVAEVDAGETARLALTRLQAPIEATGATVTVGSLPTLQADAAGLGQVFENLISNAIKFAGDREPEVEVSAQRTPDPGWGFAVADNGDGVDPDDAEQVFEMFRRLHPASIPGAGLGLATCRRIIAAHRGRIWVEPGPDGGSVFRFTIPDRDRGAA